jgi:hypothetical protein
MMPVGPEIKISTQQDPGGWITSSCFEGNIPVTLNGKIEPDTMILAAQFYPGKLYEPCFSMAAKY